MAEAGVDISRHRSKHLDELEGIDFDLVITVCNHARERCPIFPGEARVMHRGCEYPPKLAQSAGSEQEALVPYRRVRDEIRAFVQLLPGLLKDR
jgi:arsenate reductase